MMLPVVHGGSNAFLAQSANESSSRQLESSDPDDLAAANLSEALQWNFGMARNIVVDTRGTNPGEQYLSVRSDGFVDLYSRDDASGRQRWWISQVRGKWGVYNIKIAGGTNAVEEYLSCRPDGYVDLWSHDDGSGRQRWTFHRRSDGWWNIKVYGDTHVGEKYLSCTEDGTVDLWSHDDESGRQRWKFPTVR